MSLFISFEGGEGSGKTTQVKLLRDRLVHHVGKPVRLLHEPGSTELADYLRKWLLRLGLKRMQRSVFVYPFPLEREIKFFREIFGVPHGVKLVTAETIENDEDLREIFDL